MIFSTVVRALRNMYLESDMPEEIPDLASSPPRSTLYNFSTLADSVRHNRLLGTKKHMLQDPRAAASIVDEDIPWKDPQLCGNMALFDLNEHPNEHPKEHPNEHPILANMYFSLDLASLDQETGEEAESLKNIFHVHAELIRPSSIIFARHLDRGRSVVPVPGQDREVIQLFVRFLHSRNINSNLADACVATQRCETINLKLPDSSFIHFHTPDDEEKLLVRACLFGYDYSCWTFCDAVIDTLICKIIDQKRTPVLHDLLDLSTDCGSTHPLKNLIAHLAIYTWTDDQLSGFAHAHKSPDHFRFWADIGHCTAMYRPGTVGFSKAPWKKDPCYYHIGKQFDTSSKSLDQTITDLLNAEAIAEGPQATRQAAGTGETKNNDLRSFASKTSVERWASWLTHWDLRAVIDGGPRTGDVILLPLGNAELIGGVDYQDALLDAWLSWLQDGEPAGSLNVDRLQDQGHVRCLARVDDLRCASVLHHDASAVVVENGVDPD